MATPESAVKKEIRAYLDSIGAYTFMPVQTGYGAKTLDFLVCYKGRFIAIEAKAPGKVPTKFQELTIAAIDKAAGFVFVISGDLYRLKQTVQVLDELAAGA